MSAPLTRRRVVSSTLGTWPASLTSFAIAAGLPPVTACASSRRVYTVLLMGYHLSWKCRAGRLAPASPYLGASAHRRLVASGCRGHRQPVFLPTAGHALPVAGRGWLLFSIAALMTCGARPLSTSTKLQPACLSARIKRAGARSPPVPGAQGPGHPTVLHSRVRSSVSRLQTAPGYGPFVAHVGVRTISRPASFAAYSGLQLLAWASTWLFRALSHSGLHTCQAHQHRRTSSGARAGLSRRITHGSSWGSPAQQAQNRPKPPRSGPAAAGAPGRAGFGLFGHPPAGPYRRGRSSRSMRASRALLSASKLVAA